MASWLLVVSIVVVPFNAATNDHCRSVLFTEQVQGKYLKGHVIRTIQTDNYDQCQIKCFFEEKCVSYNFGGQTCDLNSSDHGFHPNDLVEEEGKSYTATKNACSKNNCLANQTCVNGFGSKGYECRCPAGFVGDHCEKAVVHGGWSSWGDWSECASEICSGPGTWKRYRKCTNPSPENEGDPCHGPAESVTQCKGLPCSCKEARERDPGLTENQAHKLWTESGSKQVYCHMTQLPGCGNTTAWTLVMKTDGSKPTFAYDSPLWTNKEPYNEADGLTGLDDKETKLPSYWTTPFTKICLGMKVGLVTKYIKIEMPAPSLHSLIADGTYRATSLGREAWKRLVEDSSLQTYCNKEGFNARCSKNGSSKARIGIVSNNEDMCDSCNSRIGFGSKGYPNSAITCGNVAKHEPLDNGEKHTAAMGYIFVH